MSDRWNHNIHYHRLVLDALPSPCGRVLDVGCGAGLLTAELAGRCEQVVGIDPHAESLAYARAALGSAGNAELVAGDVMTHPFAEPFDAVVGIAVLHHLPREAGLRRLAELLRPGGRLALVGLGRSRSLPDLAHDAAGFVATRALGRRHGGQWHHPSPIADVRESYGRVRRDTARLLPGREYRRHVLFRYSVVWTKPAATPPSAAA